MENMRKFMLTKKNKEAVLETTEINERTPERKENLPLISEPIIQEEAPVPKDDHFFEPKQSDTLFWCLYSIYHGVNDYQEIGHNYGVKEMEEKHKISDYVKQNVSKIKNTNYKITNVTLQEIMSELITVQRHTSMNVMLAMIVYYNINIIMVDPQQRCMLEFWSNKERLPGVDVASDEDDAKTYVLYKDAYGKYKLQTEYISPSKIMEMKSKMVTLDSYSRPLKQMASYKLQDLADLARQLGIYDETKHYRKIDLYDEISKLCVWN
jgi:2C-methyl-D-erythritol 2,4-cyclodiphosphate synthase